MWWLYQSVCKCIFCPFNISVRISADDCCAKQSLGKIILSIYSCSLTYDSDTYLHVEFWVFFCKTILSNWTATLFLVQPIVSQNLNPRDLITQPTFGSLCYFWLPSAMCQLVTFYAYMNFFSKLNFIIIPKNNNNNLVLFCDVDYIILYYTCWHIRICCNY